MATFVHTTLETWDPLASNFWTFAREAATTGSLEKKLTGAVPVALESPQETRRRRILEAVGPRGEGAWPGVGPETLQRYFAYLSRQLVFPFTAYYPEPKTIEERSEFRCRVTRLLDPSRHLGDEMDGLFCKTRKGSFEGHLPLGELFIPAGQPGGEAIEDYVYWFWRWR
jgi:hypothetical protein